MQVSYLLAGQPLVSPQLFCPMGSGNVVVILSRDMGVARSQGKQKGEVEDKGNRRAHARTCTHKIKTEQTKQTNEVTRRRSDCRGLFVARHHLHGMTEELQTQASEESKQVRKCMHCLNSDAFVRLYLFCFKTQPPVQWVPGIKRPGREADHSPPASRGQENMDLYTHSPIRLHGILFNLLSTGTTLPYLI
jgi:hypothetical protein